MLDQKRAQLLIIIHIAEKHFALSVLGIFLQVQGNGFGGTEELRFLAHLYTQLIAYPEKMVNGVTTSEDDATVIVQYNALLSEILSGYPFHQDEGDEGEFEFILCGQVEVGALGAFGLLLGY